MLLNKRIQFTKLILKLQLIKRQNRHSDKNPNSLISPVTKIILHKLICKCERLKMKKVHQKIEKYILEISQKDNDFHIKRLKPINQVISELNDFLDYFKSTYGIITKINKGSKSGGEQLYSFILESSPKIYFIKILPKVCNLKNVENEAFWNRLIKNRSGSLVKYIDKKIYSKTIIIVYPNLNSIRFIGVKNIQMIVKPYSELIELSGEIKLKTIQPMIEFRSRKEFRLFLNLIYLQIRQKSRDFHLIKRFKRLNRKILYDLNMFQTITNNIYTVQHNDFHPKNILLSSERIYFVDLGSIGLSSIGSDLAFLTIMLKLPYEDYKELFYEVFELFQQTLSLDIINTLVYIEKLLEQNPNFDSYVNQNFLKSLSYLEYKLSNGD